MSNKPARFMQDIMRNVTVMRGEMAEFRCRIENAGAYKVRSFVPPKSPFFNLFFHDFSEFIKSFLRKSFM